MATVNVTWTLPTERQDNTPINPISAIAGVRVELAVVGGDYAAYDTVTPTEGQQYQFTELEPGDWIVRLTVIPADSQIAETPATAQFNIANTSPFKPVGDITIDITL